MYVMMRLILMVSIFFRNLLVLIGIDIELLVGFLLQSTARYYDKVDEKKIRTVYIDRLMYD